MFFYPDDMKIHTWNLNFNFKFQVFPSRQDRKTNSFVRCLGEVTDRQFFFEIYCPLLCTLIHVLPTSRYLGRHHNLEEGTSCFLTTMVGGASRWKFFISLRLPNLGVFMSIFRFGLGTQAQIRNLKKLKNMPRYWSPIPYTVSQFFWQVLMPVILEDSFS